MQSWIRYTADHAPKPVIWKPVIYQYARRHHSITHTHKPVTEYHNTGRGSVNFTYLRRRTRPTRREGRECSAASWALRRSMDPCPAGGPEPEREMRRRLQLERSPCRLRSRRCRRWRRWGGRWTADRWRRRRADLPWSTHLQPPTNSTHFQNASTLQFCNKIRQPSKKLTNAVWRGVAEGCMRPLTSYICAANETAATELLQRPERWRWCAEDQPIEPSGRQRSSPLRR